MLVQAVHVMGLGLLKVRDFPLKNTGTEGRGCSQRLCTLIKSIS